MKQMLLAAALVAGPVIAQAAGGYDPSLDPKRYDGCVRAIAADAAKAEQFAIEWQGLGGGLPARHCQALAQIQQKKFTAAASTLVKAAEAADADSSPFAVDFWGQAGNAALLAGDSRGAIAHFTKALAGSGEAASSRTANLLIDRARAETEAGDAAAARLDLDRAVAMDRDNPAGWMLSAALARRQGDMGRASREISRASTLAPSDPDILLEQGNVAAANGDAEAARKVWEMVVKADPASPAAELATKALAAR
jgi:tetratricopeptide (TPR) repeat protein